MKHLIFFMLLPLSILAQVPNDDIHYARSLKIGESSASSTVDCTIQSSCVNYALTKKCIKYHNDQWFTVNSGQNNFLYINIQNQECRDLLGVQLVVIEGEACDIKNYKIMECISFSSNDDFYARIDSLKPDTDYLLNIDGYLHDFCSFEITADTIPYGIPNEVNLDLKSEGTIDDASIVSLKWELPVEKANQILFFEILERTDQYKHELIDKVPVRRNSYGSIEKEYFFTDTLRDNSTHNYKLLAVDQKGQKFLIDEYAFKGYVIPPLEYITVSLSYKDETPLTITISDKESGRQYYRSRFHFDRIKHQRLTYPVANMVKQGVKSLIIEVENNKTKDVTKREYLLQ